MKQTWSSQVKATIPFIDFLLACLLHVVESPCTCVAVSLLVIFVLSLASLFNCLLWSTVTLFLSLPRCLFDLFLDFSAGMSAGPERTCHSLIKSEINIFKGA